MHVRLSISDHMARDWRMEDVRRASGATDRSVDDVATNPESLGAVVAPS